jgi:two-component system OmpR family response regulator/two-component system response regulator QseB
VRLLLVEDEPEVRWLLRETLEEAGWAVDEAAGVGESKGLLEAFPYDLLVLDLALPDGEGLEVLRAVRLQGMALPVLILTWSNLSTRRRWWLGLEPFCGEAGACPTTG